MLSLEAIQAQGQRAQSGRQQRLQSFFGQREAIAHHAPRIAPSQQLPTDLLQILAQEHLATRQDDQLRARIDMGRNLFVEHPQKIG